MARAFAIAAWRYSYPKKGRPGEFLRVRAPEYVARTRLATEELTRLRRASSWLDCPPRLRYVPKENITPLRLQGARRFIGARGQAVDPNCFRCVLPHRLLSVFFSTLTRAFGKLQLSSTNVRRSTRIISATWAPATTFSASTKQQLFVGIGRSWFSNHPPPCKYKPFIVLRACCSRS